MGERKGRPRRVTIEPLEFPKYKPVPKEVPAPEKTPASPTKPKRRVPA